MSSVSQRVSFIILFAAIISQSLFSQTAVQPLGSGTANDPYQIDSLANLYWITQDTSLWSSYFLQTADIDASPTSTWFYYNAGGSNYYYKGFPPIGNSYTTYFSGTYDGGGHTITGLYSYLSDHYEGLFGRCIGATIKNVRLINVNLKTGNYGGGVAGYLQQGSMSNCSVIGGTVLGGAAFSPVGSLVGQSRLGTIIDQCYSLNVDVLAGNSGEFIGAVGDGSNPSSTTIVSNCYCIDTTTTESTSGFVCDNWGTVNNCYTVYGDNGGFGPFYYSNSGTITNCFYDEQTANDTSQSFGITTAQMKSNSTFINAGWDSNIWYMDNNINSGYPYLAWQNSGGTPLPVELSTFTADILNNKVELQWQTATEVNNYGFEVQRTIQNSKLKIQNFEKIGFVKGNGNSNSPKNYSFIDDNPPSGTVVYRLKQIDNDGNFKYSQIVTVNSLPTKFELFQNYPNPFNPTTTIKYQINSIEFVSLKVFDALGQEIITLVNENKLPGIYSVRFDGSNLSGGVYFYRLQAGSFYQTKKLVLLK